MVSRAVAALIAVFLLGALLRLESPRLDPALTLYTALTDEGWWAASALRAARGGPLVLPGDYNPVLISPVWTALLWLAFKLFGASLATARLASGLCGALSGPALYWAFARDLARPERALAAALMTLSFGAVAFSRMAILDGPLMLAMILAAGAHRRALAGGSAILSALALALAVLTKTSGLVLVPVFIADAGLSAWRGTSRPAAFRAVLAALAGAAAWPALSALASARWPADWAVMAGSNVSDKLPQLAQVKDQVLWYLAFNQLIENAPFTLLCAWTATGALLWSRFQDTEAGGGAPLAALWFLAASGAVAVLPYQPKRYHLLAFPPACVLTGVLCVRAAAASWSRRATFAGLSLASLILGFVIAMGRMRAAGLWIPQPTLHPDNAAELVQRAAVAIAGLWTLLAVLAATTGRVPLKRLMVALVLLELAHSAHAWATWRRSATSTAVEASQAVAAAMRADTPAPVLAGNVAHTVALESGVDARWLSIEPRLKRRVIPVDPVTHLIVDDRRDLAIWQAEQLPLAGRLRSVGRWSVDTDQEPLRTWELYRVY